MSKGKDPHAYPHSVICVNETESALKITPLTSGAFQPFWVPKSVIHDDSEVYEKGDEGQLIVHEWFALKEWE